MLSQTATAVAILDAGNRVQAVPGAVEST